VARKTDIPSVSTVLGWLEDTALPLNDRLDYLDELKGPRWPEVPKALRPHIARLEAELAAGVAKAGPVPGKDWTYGVGPDGKLVRRLPT
jgi:hypothetical protein